MVETKKEWFVRDNWSARELGLFKLEFEGIRGIALSGMCSFIHSFIHTLYLNTVKASVKVIGQLK